MCGIFGYTGVRTVTPILVDGLRALEYRGYDSAGIYIPQTGVTKAVGAIDNLAKKLDEEGGEHPAGTSGIAHTRWATHGEPTEINAHPHAGKERRVWIVHNGIIENYRELKDELRERGHTFLSDTDTEVLAHLIESYVTAGLSLKDAVSESLQAVRGTYGIAAVDMMDPETIVVARMGSPIVLGVSEHGHIVSSDPSGLLALTKDVIYLEDGEIAVLTPKKYLVETLSREDRTRGPERIEWDIEEVQKNGHEHFMLKEIMEGPEVLANSARGRLIPEQGRAKLGGLEPVREELQDISRLTIVACGSSYYVGQIGKYMLEEYAGVPTDVELGSEYRYKKHIPDPKSVALAITQSGETADTLASIREAKRLGLLTLGIVNTVGSTIARETDAGVYNHAGPEIGVASTKAFISQLEIMALLTLFIGRERGMSLEEGKDIVEAIRELPEHVDVVLNQRSAIKKIAEKYKDYRDFLFVGRTFHLPIAYEGALKLKEVSYVHAEGYGAGEMKHGPIAMIDEQFPTIAIVPQDDVYEKMISNIEEVKARKGPVVALAHEGDEQIAELADDVMYMPKVHPIVQPIVSTVPLQLLAYYIGTAKGYNVDRPRNLAKSVTVE